MEITFPGEISFVELAQFYFVDAIYFSHLLNRQQQDSYRRMWQQLFNAAEAGEI